MCTLLDDVDEPLLDELPLDDELPDEDEEDDVVLSSSLSTSRFLRGAELDAAAPGAQLDAQAVHLSYWVVMCCRMVWGCLVLPSVARASGC